MRMLQFFVLVVLSLASGSLGLNTLGTASRPGLVGRRYRRDDASLSWLDVVDSVEGNWLL